jgi:hypothetical protein
VATKKIIAMDATHGGTFYTLRPRCHLVASAAIRLADSQQENKNVKKTSCAFQFFEGSS